MNVPVDHRITIAYQSVQSWEMTNMIIGHKEALAEHKENSGSCPEHWWHLSWNLLNNWVAHIQKRQSQVGIGAEEGFKVKQFMSKLPYETKKAAKWSQRGDMIAVFRCLPTQTLLWLSKVIDAEGKKGHRSRNTVAMQHICRTKWVWKSTLAFLNIARGLCRLPRQRPQTGHRQALLPGSRGSVWQKEVADGRYLLCPNYPPISAYSCPSVSLTKSFNPWQYFNSLQMLPIYCGVPLPEGSRFLFNSPGKDYLSLLASWVYEVEVKGA